MRPPFPDVKAVRPPGRPRKRPRSTNPEIRQRLLDAATALIHEQGFPQLRVEEIAEGAGVAVGTFYLYFDGKDDLFVQLVLESTEGLALRLRRAYALGDTLAERLLSGLEAYLRHVEENDKLFLYFRDAGSIHTTVGNLSAWVFRRLGDELRPLLDEGMASGELHAVDAEMLAQAMLGLIHQVAGYWLEHRTPAPRDDIKQFLANVLACGIWTQLPDTEPSAHSTTDLS